MPSAKKKLDANFKPSAAMPKKPKQHVFLVPPPVAGRVLISFKQTAAKLGCHETTPYRYLKNKDMPDFPRPIQVTPHRRAFFEDEIDRWLATRPRS